MILHLFGPKMADLVAAAAPRVPVDPATPGQWPTCPVYVVVREAQDAALLERDVARHLQNLPEYVDVAYLTEERADGATPGKAIEYFADARVRVTGVTRTLVKRREGARIDMPGLVWDLGTAAKGCRGCTFAVGDACTEVGIPLSDKRRTLGLLGRATLAWIDEHTEADYATPKPGAPECPGRVQQERK